MGLARVAAVALRAVGVAGLALSLACKGEPAVCGDDAPFAELVRGDDPDVDLADGDPIVMVHGPQGGWHLEFGLRAVDPNPRIEFDLTVDAPQGQIVDNHYDLKLAAHDGCAGWRTQLYGFISIADIREDRTQTPPDLLTGAELHMQLRVESSLGISTDEVWLVAEPDPRDAGD